MWTFTLKRIIHLIPILLGVSMLTFLLMALTPGDYLTTLMMNPQISPEKVNELRVNFGLDKPWYIQYLYWLKNALMGDLGYSFAYKTSATQLNLLDSADQTDRQCSWNPSESSSGLPLSIICR